MEWNHKFGIVCEYFKKYVRISVWVLELFIFYVCICTFMYLSTCICKTVLNAARMQANHVFHRSIRTTLNPMPSPLTYLQSRSTHCGGLPNWRREPYLSVEHWSRWSQQNSSFQLRVLATSLCPVHNPTNEIKMQQAMALDLINSRKCKMQLSVRITSECDIWDKLERSSRRQNIKANPKESGITLKMKSEKSHAFEEQYWRRQKKCGKGPRKLIWPKWKKRGLTYWLMATWQLASQSTS